MRNALLITTVAGLGLAGCAEYKQGEEFSQEDFLAATQENIDGSPTTIEVFEAGTNNPGVVDNPYCIRNDIARGVSDLLAENDDRETVDVCIFDNSGNPIAISPNRPIDEVRLGGVFR